MKRLAIDQKIRLYRPRWFHKEYRRKVGTICSKMHITDFLTYFLRCFGRKKNPPGKVCNWFWSFHDIRQHLWIAFWDFLRVSTLEKKYDMGGGPLTLGPPHTTPGSLRGPGSRVKIGIKLEHIWKVKNMGFRHRNRLLARNLRRGVFPGL